MGVTLESLGRTFHAEKKLTEAENALRRSLAITEKVDGDESVEAANIDSEIGSVLLDAGHPVDALLFGRKALMTFEAKRGGASRESAGALCLIGDSLRTMRNFIDAEEPLRRCADVRESDGGIDSLEFAEALHSLALAYSGEKKYDLADKRFELAEKIREDKLGITSSLLAKTMEDHAALLRMMGRDKDADRLSGLAAAIRRGERKNAR